MNSTNFRPRQTPKTPNQTLGAVSKRRQTLVLITGLRVAGEQQLISALGETAVRWHHLTVSQNHLQIDFVGLSFAPGEALRYQYKLEETDAAGHYSPADFHPTEVLRIINY